MEGPAGGTGARGGTGDRRVGVAVLGSAVPVLMTVVALVQVVLTQTQDLTPWKGGGFGMFASVDRAEHRAVRAYLVTATGEVPALLDAPEGDPAVAGPVLIRARNLPDRGGLEALATEVGAQEWVSAEDEDGTPVAVVRDDSDDDDGSEEATGPAVAFDAVRLEVWKLGFTSEDVRIDPTQLAEITWDVP